MADERPIIIKKIKKAGHGHHGGAWKVAYADFVTAMMAFFLMLWLLSSVSEGKLESLAEYFTPTIGVRDQMGIGFEGGQTANLDGTKKSDRSPPGVIIGFEQPGPQSERPELKAIVEADQDALLFEKAESELKKAFESDPNLRDLSDNIIVEQSPEGLKIQVSDSDKRPMFNPGSISLTQHGKRALSKLGAVIDAMPNFISIEGHTDISPLSRRGSNYTNWELSADRANAARRYFIQSGMEPERPKRVVGLADTELLDANQPLSTRNRRITVILLRGSYLELSQGAVPASRDLLSVPRPGKRIGEKVQQLKDEQSKGAAPLSPNALTPGAKPTGTSSPDDNVPIDNSADTAPIQPATAPPRATERNIDDFQEFLDE